MYEGFRCGRVIQSAWGSVMAEGLKGEGSGACREVWKRDKLIEKNKIRETNE